MILSLKQRVFRKKLLILLRKSLIYGGQTAINIKIYGWFYKANYQNAENSKYCRGASEFYENRADCARDAAA